MSLPSSHNHLCIRTWFILCPVVIPIQDVQFQNTIKVHSAIDTGTETGSWITPQSHVIIIIHSAIKVRISGRFLLSPVKGTQKIILGREKRNKYFHLFWGDRKFVTESGTEEESRTSSRILTTSVIKRQVWEEIPSSFSFVTEEDTYKHESWKMYIFYGFCHSASFSQYNWMSRKLKYMVLWGLNQCKWQEMVSLQEKC